MNILITGTSSGLGAGLAAHYLKQGHSVYGISRKSNAALNGNHNFKFLSQDLSVFEEVENKTGTFLKGITTLDLVILNAGILNEIKDMKDTSLEEIKKVMDVNVWSNKILIDVLFNTIPDIKQVVAISSGASLSGARGWNAYALSKVTLNMLIKLYAREHLDTHFSALAPGLIDTAMQEYIYGLPDDERFSIVQVLKNAKGTYQMPDPEHAAKNLSIAIGKISNYKSGVFFDIRDLD